MPFDPGVARTAPDPNLPQHRATCAKFPFSPPQRRPTLMIPTCHTSLIGLPHLGTEERAETHMSSLSTPTLLIDLE